PVHPHFVVHGHSVDRRPVIGRWRAGLDTGAYLTGHLTTLRLEGDDRRLLRVSEGDPTVREWDRVYVGYSQGPDAQKRQRGVKPMRGRAAARPAPRKGPGLWRTRMFATVTAAGLLFVGAA